MYYATYDPYGDETSPGFRNTKQLRIFRIRADRDAWVNEMPTHNFRPAKGYGQAREAVSFAEAKRIFGMRALKEGIV